MQEANEWKSSFKNLIKYDPKDGHEIAYTVQESEVSNYASSISGDMIQGIVLTNTNTETVSVPVSKFGWDLRNPRQKPDAMADFFSLREQIAALKGKTIQIEKRRHLVRDGSSF